MCEVLNKVDIIGLDTETTGLYWWKDKLVALSLAIEDGRAWVLTGEWLAKTLPWLRATLLSERATLVGHNLKFDLHFLFVAMMGVFEPAATLIDTSIALFLLNENAENDLKSAVWRLFKHRMMTFKQVVGTVAEETGESRTRKCQTCRCAKSKLADCATCKGTGVEGVAKTRKRQRTIDEVPVSEWAHYSAEDAYYPLLIWRHAQPRLQAAERLYANFTDVQMPLMLSLLNMEHKGIRIDVDAARALRARHWEELVENEVRLLEVTVANKIPKVNWSSPAQVDELLYKTLGYLRPPFRPSRKDSAGNRVTSKYRTDEACLLWLAQEHDCKIAKLLLERRKLTKYIGTYLDNMLANVVVDAEGNAILYPNFNQTVARSGRLSSSDPLNFQNIPGTPEFRALFIARPGHKFLVADTKQVELRMLGHYSQDKVLLRAFEDDRDLHAETAKELGLDAFLSKHDARVAAKRGNFGVAYGVYGNTFRRAIYVDSEGQINLPKERADDIVEGLNARYAGVTAWKKRVIAQLRAHGFLETLDGRRRRLPHVGSSNWGLRSYAERQGVNVLIQGGVADLINRALNNVRMVIGNIFLLQVHDEIICEVPKNHVVNFNSLLREAIEEVARPFNLAVDIICDVQEGETWNCKS